MPTAEQFTAFGVGNGFTACLTKIDVSSEDKWTTLSGVNKGSPTTSDALIAESLQLAMELFWNLNGFGGSSHKEGTIQPTEDVTLTLDMYAEDYEYTNWHKTVGGVDADVNKEPEERVCYGSFRAGKLDPFFGFWDTIGLDVKIRRMYNGVTTNEDNFVGYGSSGGIEIATDNFEFLDLYSWFDEPYGITEYVEFSGAHYVANLEASEPDGFPDANYSIAVVADNLVGTYTEGAPVTYSLTMTIEPLDFYTYE
jgi:hypothetical protein